MAPRNSEIVNHSQLHQGPHHPQCACAACQAVRHWYGRQPAAAPKPKPVRSTQTKILYAAISLGIAVYFVSGLLEAGLVPRGLAWRLQGGHLRKASEVPSLIESAAGCTRCEVTEVEIQRKVVMAAVKQGDSVKLVVAAGSIGVPVQTVSDQRRAFKLRDVMWSLIPKLVEREIDRGENPIKVRVAGCRGQEERVCISVDGTQFDASTGDAL